VRAAQVRRTGQEGGEERTALESCCAARGVVAELIARRVGHGSWRRRGGSVRWEVDCEQEERRQTALGGEREVISRSAREGKRGRTYSKQSTQKTQNASGESAPLRIARRALQSMDRAPLQH
jgi:hypothetical protein